MMRRKKKSKVEGSEDGLSGEGKKRKRSGVEERGEGGDEKAAKKKKDKNKVKGIAERK